MKACLRRHALALLLCATSLGQTVQQGPQASGAAPKGIDQAAVYEAVVRFQIQSWKLAAQSYCIEVKGKDPAKELLDRLQPLPVKRASACQKRHDWRGISMEVVDKKNRKPAVIFDVGEIHRRTDAELDVDGGYLCASLCMAGGTYRVIWDGSRWLVNRFDISVQS